MFIEQSIYVHFFTFQLVGQQVRPTLLQFRPRDSFPVWDLLMTSHPVKKADLIKSSKPKENPDSWK
jgi:hypothetical protein